MSFIANEKYITVPSVTTTERNALTAANGMFVYDSDLNLFYKYENGAWSSFGGGSYSRTVVDTNTTAANDTDYTLVASATFTDPTPAEGKGYSVLVRNGTATIGGTGYSTVGQLLWRIYHSGAWATYQLVTQTQLDTKFITIPFLSNFFNPADGTNYFFGGISNLLTPSTTNTDQDFTIGFAGTVIGCVIQAHGNATQGSNEDVTLSLRNNTANTTTTIGVFKTNATSTTTVSTAITGISIAVGATDSICLQMNGTWATNPQGLRLTGYLMVRI
jgi:hypothetical protein